MRWYKINKIPFLIAVTGYIIGILWGLYFNFSIVFLYTLIAAIYLINKKVNKKDKKLKLISIHRYFKYIKIFFNKKTIVIIITISIISNLITIIQKNKYDNLYQEKEYTFIAKIISDKIEKDYKNLYKIEIIEADNSNKYKKTYLNMLVDKKINLEYGDVIKGKGIFNHAKKSKNFGGFDYNLYLKTEKIYGIFNAKKVKKIDNRIDIGYLANKVKNLIEEKIDIILDEKNSELCKGLILGKTTKIEEKIKENFIILNISHILAISGMHVSCIIIIITIIFQKFMGKRSLTIFIILILIFYMFLVGFTPSIVRACFMGIFINVSFLVHRKNNFWNTLSISLLIILISNPYSILNIGLQLSYFATIGILVFNKNINKIFNNIKFLKKSLIIKTNSKIATIAEKFKNIITVMLSAQIMIFPLMIYYFNIFGVYFIISNILVSIIIAPIILVSIVAIITSFINISIAKFFSSILTILFKLLINISNLSNLPFSKSYIPTPKISIIIIYYIIICVLNYIYIIYNGNINNITCYRMRNLIAFIKYKIRKNKIKIINLILIMLIIFIILNILPKKLKIFFIDVGQGDATFIITPKNNTILVDGGGSLDDGFDIGKKILIPYILDRGYNKIDYIFISHFDWDHVGGILTILEELKVKKIIIGKQFEESENYKKFLRIVKEKKIEVLKISKGDRLTIDNIKFDILWPNINDVINEKKLNNNSVVMKLIYGNFSMLFTGDIEEAAEKQIIKAHNKNRNILNTNVLKVAHHGSKSSSIINFLNLVKPNVALIGVGENNKFGHPDENVINRIKSFHTQVYRTDKNGEIRIKVNRKGKYLVKPYY